MREIKFRAWDTRNKELISDWPEFYRNPGFFDFNGDDRFIVMQYTGLKDKIGKEIYEGDVIYSDSSAGKKKHTVVYGKTGFLAEGKNENDLFYTPLNERDEVIGNIYENVELLK